MKALVSIATLLAVLLISAVGAVYFTDIFVRHDPRVVDRSDESLLPKHAEAMISRVLEGFYDPDAARLASITYMKSEAKPTHICGWANGKNRYGGYVGYRPFFYVIESQAVHFLPDLLSVKPETESAFAGLVEEMGCPRPTP